jgi:hypothetical protein
LTDDGDEEREDLPMKTMDSIDRYVIRRESNVLRVDFHREPDPPALRFPGAGALRHQDPLGESVDAVTPARAASGRRC